MQYFLTCSKLEIKLLISKLIKVNFFFCQNWPNYLFNLEKIPPSVSPLFSSLKDHFLSSSLSLSLDVSQSPSIFRNPRRWWRGKNIPRRVSEGDASALARQKWGWSKEKRGIKEEGAVIARGQAGWYAWRNGERIYTHLVCDDMTSTRVAKY